MELWDINTQMEAAACFKGCSPSRPQIRTVLSPPHEASNVPAGFHRTDQQRESGWALSFWTEDKVSFISDPPWSHAEVHRCHSRRYNNKRQQRPETPTESPELVKVSDGKRSATSTQGTKSRKSRKLQRHNCEGSVAIFTG